MDKEVIITDINTSTVIGRMKREAKTETLQTFFNNSLQGSLHLQIYVVRVELGMHESINLR